MWVLITVAMAAETDVGSLTTLLRDLSEQTGKTVLVAGAGADVAKAAEKVAADNTDLALKVLSVPTLGDVDAEMARVLSASGLTCGVRVAVDDTDGSWALSTHGDCDEASEAPEAAKSAAGALSAEQKVKLVADYNASALERRRPEERVSGNPMITGSSPNLLPWQVWDGGGTALSTTAFAEAIGDQATLDELEADARAARKRRTTLSIVGPVAIAGGALLALGVQPFDLATSPVGSSAHKGQAFTQDLLTLGASALIAGGAGSLTLGLVQVPLAKQRAAKVHKYYSSSEADKRIETFNGDTLFKLGLRSADLRAPAPAAEPATDETAADTAPAAPAEPTTAPVP